MKSNGCKNKGAACYCDGSCRGEPKNELFDNHQNNESKELKSSVLLKDTPHYKRVPKNFRDIIL